MRPSQIFDGTPIGSRKPWFSFPLARFVETITPVATSVRTLPDDQLAAELEQLVALCAQPGHHLAHRLMLRIYEADVSRRADPLRQFDAELDAALSRLARNTNAPDRQIVRDIGEKLFDVGGTKAMQDAMRRSLAAVDPDRRELRQRFIEKRWAGIGGRLAG